MNNTGATKSSGKGKRFLTLFLSAVAVGGLLYFSGYFVGRRGLNDARAALAKAKADSKTQIATAQAAAQTEKQQSERQIAALAAQR